MVLERDAHRHVDLHRVGIDVHEVGREAHARLLDDLDDRDDVRQLRARHPRLVVDRIGRDRRPPRHRFGRQVLRMAHRADRLERVDEVLAVLAAPEHELAPLAALPEAPVVIGELRQDAERNLGDRHRCLRHSASVVGAVEAVARERDRLDRGQQPDARAS